MSCRNLVNDLKGAVPPVDVFQGESCEALLKDLAGTTFDHLPLKNFFDESKSSCPAGLKVTGADPIERHGISREEIAQEGADKYILPFNLQFDRTAASCMEAPEMDYISDIGIFDGGYMDAWNTARAPGMGMSYFNRTDLPYYYALADAFTVGDAYHQSTFTATNPNRLHLFSGSNGLSVAGSGYNELDDSEPLPGFEWETMAETLIKYNVSWQVIQEKDNFDDNAFAWFKNFREAQPGNPLYDNGMARVPDLVQTFADQVGNDSLPQVTWIVGPTSLSEHATNHPADGEDLSHRLINILADPANAAVYAKTVFILNYDEGGQFFDHHWTPVPPKNDGVDGKSTVTTVGELTLQNRFGVAAGNPIGLGFRVPMFIISPWTRGPYTFSEVADHTSVIKFIEARFGVRCPNISPWRRAVVSDLLSAFHWDSPDYSWPTSMPSTAANVNQSKWQCEHLPKPTLPTVQTLPVQEPGTRLALPTRYNTNITEDMVAGGITLTMANQGSMGVVLFVYDRANTSSVPRKFTIENGKALDDTWASPYNLSMHGPDGFVRTFNSDDSHVAVGVSVSMLQSPATQEVVFELNANTACRFVVTDNAYGLDGPMAHDLPCSSPIHLAGSYQWYDFTVTMEPSDKCAVSAGFERRFMGRLPTGKVTVTDPAMGAEQPADEEAHPRIHDFYRVLNRWNPKTQCKSRRGRHKDACWGFGAEETPLGHDHEL